MGLERSVIKSGLALPYGLEGPVKELLEEFPSTLSKLRWKEDLLTSLNDENFVLGFTKFNFKLARSDELGDSALFEELSKNCDDAIKAMQGTIKSQILAATKISIDTTKAKLFTTVKNFATKIALANLINETDCREPSLEKLAKEIVCDVYKADREWKSFVSFDTDLNAVQFYESPSIKSALITDKTLTDDIWKKMVTKVSIGLAEIVHSSSLKYEKSLKEKETAIRIRKATAIMSARAGAESIADGIDISMDIEVQESFNDQNDRIKKLEASLVKLAKNNGGAKKGASNKKKSVKGNPKSKKKSPNQKKKGGNGASGEPHDTSANTKKPSGGKNKKNAKKRTGKKGN